MGVEHGAPDSAVTVMVLTRRLLETPALGGAGSGSRFPPKL
jgi:hypothetical protein